MTETGCADVSADRANAAGVAAAAGGATGARRGAGGAILGLAVGGTNCRYCKMRSGSEIYPGPSRDKASHIRGSPAFHSTLFDKPPS